MLGMGQKRLGGRGKTVIDKAVPVTVSLHPWDKTCLGIAATDTGQTVSALVQLAVRRLLSDAATYVCPNCGKQVKRVEDIEDNLYCPACGKVALAHDWRGVIFSLEVIDQREV